MDVCENRIVDKEFERGRSFGLGATLGDGHTDRYTHVQKIYRHFLQTTFLERESETESKCIKVDFFDESKMIHTFF